MKSRELKTILATAHARREQNRSIQLTAMAAHGADFPFIYGSSGAMMQYLRLAV